MPGVLRGSVGIGFVGSLVSLWGMFLWRCRVNPLPKPEKLWRLLAGRARGCSEDMPGQVGQDVVYDKRYCTRRVVVHCVNIVSDRQR